MQSIPTTLDHLVLPPEHFNGDKHPALIMLHGRGANEEDLAGLAAGFDRSLLILSVRAPFPFSFDGGYTWYDIGALGAPEPRMFRESSDRLERFIQDAREQYPIDPKRILLLGFSMGTAMALTYALSHPGSLRGVVAHSGYLPEQTHLSYFWDRMEASEVLITHGIEDPVIPLFMARRTRDLFQASPARVTYREFPGGHEITQEMAEEASRFVAGLISAPGS
jgi:phospholipase/carboxylesterase